MDLARLIRLLLIDERKPLKRPFDWKPADGSPKATSATS